MGPKLFQDAPDGPRRAYLSKLPAKGGVFRASRRTEGVAEVVRDPRLRHLLETEGDRARKEYESLSAGPQTKTVTKARAELRERFEEAERLLGGPLPHDRIIRNQKKQERLTLWVAFVLLLFAILWGAFALGTKARLHGIDANVRRLVERFSEQGLRPE
jgi:hypothetical protein